MVANSEVWQVPSLRDAGLGAQELSPMAASAEGVWLDPESIYPTVSSGTFVASKVGSTCDLHKPEVHAGNSSKKR